jgi:hypothetical protein
MSLNILEEEKVERITKSTNFRKEGKILPQLSIHTLEEFSAKTFM